MADTHVNKLPRIGRSWAERQHTYPRTTNDSAPPDAFPGGAGGLLANSGVDMGLHVSVAGVICGLRKDAKTRDTTDLHL